MKLAHTGNNRLSRFRIGMHPERRIFFRQALQSDPHFFLIVLRLWLHRHRDNRIREYHRFQNDRMVFVTQRIARRRRLQTDRRRNIAAVYPRNFRPVIRVHLQDTP